MNRFENIHKKGILYWNKCTTKTVSNQCSTHDNAGLSHDIYTPAKKQKNKTNKNKTKKKQNTKTKTNKKTNKQANKQIKNNVKTFDWVSSERS